MNVVKKIILIHESEMLLPTNQTVGKLSISIAGAKARLTYTVIFLESKLVLKCEDANQQFTIPVFKGDLHIKDG